MSNLYGGGSLATSGLSAGQGRSARSPLSGLTNRGGQTGPGRLVRCELLPQVSHPLGDLTAGHAVLEGRHVAEIACGGGGGGGAAHRRTDLRRWGGSSCVSRRRRPGPANRRGRR